MASFAWRRSLQRVSSQASPWAPARFTRKSASPTGLPKGRITIGSCNATSAFWANTSPRAKPEPSLERRLETRVERPRPRRTDRARVGERRATIGEIGNGGGIEEGAEGRVAIVEDVVDATVDLDRLVDLIRGTKIENGIGRQSRRLVGFIPHEVLAADEQRIAADLEGIGDRIIETGLDPIAGDRRNSVARHDLDIAVAVRKRTVGAELQGVEEARIDEGIAGIELQRFRGQRNLRFDALASRRTDVLEIAESLQLVARYRQDVIGIFRAESTELPSKGAQAQLRAAAQTCLHSM